MISVNGSVFFLAIHANLACFCEILWVFCLVFSFALCFITFCFDNCAMYVMYHSNAIV